MKKSIVLYFFMVYCLSPIFSQEQNWKKIGNFSDNTLWAIHFPTKNTGYIVGDGGVLLKTTDAGENWTTLSVPDNRWFRSIHFTSKNTGYGGSSIDYIYKTTDGGKTWTVTKLNDSFELNALYFQNASTGFAAGWLRESSPLIHKTTDAGKTWTGYPVQLDGNKSAPIINSIAFADAQTGYAVGEYGIGPFYALVLKTTDGGKTWKEENPGIIACFQDITFVNSKTGFIAGDRYHNEPGETGLQSIVLKTTDGGKTWNQQIFPSTYAIRSIYFPDEQTGYFTTFLSAIYKTTDGGETWKPQTIDGLKGSTCIYFTDKETGFVGGMYGEVFKSTPILPGIEDETADALPAAFPNPARETVTLPYSLTNQNEGVLKIFNAGGGLMEQVKVTNEDNMVRIGLDGFPAGIYFYSCDGKSGKFTVE